MHSSWYIVIPFLSVIPFMVFFFLELFTKYAQTLIFIVDLLGLFNISPNIFYFPIVYSFICSAGFNAIE